ncbi:MAG: aldehyde ferredoxin oxidoreductase family protein [Limnochordia bacterium]|jgi:aldehyde:ferredoxin oxidoreductase
MSGYTGRILRVNLTTGQIDIEQPDETIYRRYLGGGALATYYMLKELAPGIDPLGPENKLFFMISPIVGSPVAGASRFTVAGKSPLTGGFGESEAGGYWGPELKFAGFDGVIVEGQSEKPVYLWIHNGQAEIRDASHIWGKTTGEAEAMIREELGDKRIRVAQCGPAGENLVRYACVLNNCKHANGRTGMGAVMGSKKLRAIAVRGTDKPKFADPETVRAIGKWFADRWRDDDAAYGMHFWGTSRGIKGLDAGGILPTHNFVTGTFEKADEISGEAIVDQVLIDREGCYACPIRCKRVVKVEEPYNVDPFYGGPEYETVGSLGSLLDIGDLKPISKGNELCNKYGLDTISVGTTIAFAMECYENGLLTKEDTGGLELNFGNEEVMLQLLEMITRREGIGDLLADGVRIAAEKIGRGAEKYAMHVKGQELPMHEPRGKNSLALAYALSPTGADHMENPHDPGFAAPGNMLDNVAALGLLEPLPSIDLSDKKVRQFFYLQQIWSLYNSICLCDFVATPTYPLSFEKIIELLNAATGWNTSLYELLKIGERANTLSRVYNVREGFTRADDTLPERLFEPLASGALEGVAIDREEFDKALSTYYAMAGWDEEGVPTKAKLEELDIGWTAELL